MSEFFTIIFLITATLLAGLVIFKIAEIRSCHKHARQSDSSQFEQINIGCSFSPERYNHNKNFADSKPAVDALRFIIKDLGIKQIRFGIRWNMVVDEKGTFDFKFYRPYLDFLLGQDIDLCLNIGPVKTFGWPEVHFPKYFLKKIKVRNFSKISSQSLLAKYAFEYTHELLRYLKKNYSSQELRGIKIIQIDNEPFNYFGSHKIVFSNDYLLNICKVTGKYFPDAKILLNSAGRTRLGKIIKFIKYAAKLLNLPTSKFILGFDYYYQTEGRDKFFLTRLLDNISISLPFNMSAGRLKSVCQKLGVEIEITEAQMEPWGKNQSPGNSYLDFKYVLLRNIKKVLNFEEGKKSLIRLWGMEYLVSKVQDEPLTSQHRKIFALIRTINRTSPVSCKSSKLTRN